MGAAHLPRRPLADKFLHGAIVPANAYLVPNFNFLVLIVSEIKRVSQNLMWRLLPPYRGPYIRGNFYVCPSTWQAETGSQISASYLYASCIAHHALSALLHRASGTTCLLTSFSVPSLAIFKRRLKTHLLGQSFG